MADAEKDFEADVRNFGLVHVLRHGFRFLGVSKPIRVICFKPESKLNGEAQELYAANDRSSSLS